jgi:hypothetical protein
MGLKDILSWWSRRADTEALQREREAEVTGERPTDRDTYESYKVDTAIHGSRSGAEAESASAGDLDDV